MANCPPTTYLEQVAVRLERVLEQYRTTFLAAASALCVLTFTGYCLVKAPWMDEVLTLTTIRQPDMGRLWAALKAAYEADPPFLETIVHYAFRLFGDHVLLARMPAVLGFTLACLCLSLVVWRHTSALYGAAAFYLPFATALRVRATDVRPYGMMMGFSALAVLCWDRMGDEKSPHRTAWRAAFTASLMAALFTHFFSIWLLVGLGTGELCRWIARRRIDWLTPVSVAIAFVPWLLSLRVLADAQQIFEVKQGHLHAHVAYKTLFDFFGQQFEGIPLAGVLILLALGLAATAAERKAATAGVEPKAAIGTGIPPRRRDLLAAAGGFLLMPFVGYAVALVVTKFFIAYYYMLVAFGMVIGLPLLLFTLAGPRSPLAGLCLAIPMVANGLSVSARGLSGFVRHENPYPAIAELRRLVPEPDAEFVVTSPAQFLPYYEATHSSALVYLVDRGKALRQIGTNTSEIIYDQVRPFNPARSLPFDAYTSARPHYYAVVFEHGQGLDDWQFDYLLTRGQARLRWMGKAGAAEVFRVELPVVGAR